MADAVQRVMEEMVPELEDLQRKRLFSKAEVRAIVSKRTAFEYALLRRTGMTVGADGARSAVSQTTTQTAAPRHASLHLHRRRGRSTTHEHSSQ
jgi:hypothetical protein